MAEETVYSDDTVSVTTARVIISGTTYALHNITSVKMTFTPAKKGCAVTLLIVSIWGLLGAGGAFSKSVGTGLGGLFLTGGIIAGAIAWMCACKPDYHVAIASSSGEAHVLTSKDKGYIEKIVASINDAIVRHE